MNKEQTSVYNTERILIVDDEQGLLHMLKITFQKERFNNIDLAASAVEAMEYVRNNTYDIILLDVMLPDFSGFELCSEIRKYTFTPIIFITACDGDFDKLRGLTIGGDDYITKPFNPLEVVARVNAILRRQKHYISLQENIKQDNDCYDYGLFTVSPSDATLMVNGEIVECTAKEYELLLHLCRNPNRVFTLTQLYEAVWNSLSFGDEKTVTMHISKLRKKLGDDTKSPSIIVNIRGIGYKFVPPAKV
jgi:DNA-binding response OmpR family regulator